MDHDDEVQALRNNFNTQIDILRKDIRFYQIALNLSGKRENLENEAAELIKKKGYIKALEGKDG